MAEASEKPVCVVVLGMAGSGKTTFIAKLVSHLTKLNKNPYVINLDPAVYTLPYPVNIDIRDTVKYKEVMNQYELGPNGAIITSLNLFTTRFDQVIDIIKKRSQCKYFIFDTPGQIEVFTWSASGAIITETLASLFPTVVTYIMDTPRNHSPVTFMSNMLYSCSILFKSMLPFLVVFNKIDIINHQFALDWMKDFEAFEDALSTDPSYISNLSRSLSLVLEDYYENLKTVGVSSLTGEGMEEMVQAIGQGVEEYHNDFKKMYEELKKEKTEKELKKQEEQLKRLKIDLKTEAPNIQERSNKPYLHYGLNPNDDEDDEDEDEKEIKRIEEDDEEEKTEYESFKRFLNQSTKEKAEN